MSTKLIMGRKELLRAKMMEMVKLKQKTLTAASKIIGVSYRQAKRIYRRYLLEGDSGLIHKNTGKPSPNSKSSSFKEKVIEIVENNTKFKDFAPTFASEKLLELYDLKVDHETLRRWMIEKGLWKIKRRRRKHRSRRDRKEQFGEMVQFDGSLHDWFEGRRGKCCLMNMVDDAKGTTLSFLTEEETTDAAMMLLWSWIEQYGIPQAVYCDRKNAFVLTREPTLEEQLQGIEPKSHFQKACEKLGIEVIIAYSPQAKGRVERNHGVYQDRFVKELRLMDISTIEDANDFLEKTYLPKINSKFEKEALCSIDAHVPIESTESLKDILCYEYERTVSNDIT